MGKKQVRDPNAPKRNLSAYLLFQNAMRNTFKSQHPDFSFGQLSKHTSQMYGALTVEEKAAWQDRAESDKTRYLSEISKYVPPAGYDARGDAILPPPPPAFSMNPAMMGGYEHNRVPMKPTKRVKCRDPHAPKRNLSAYLLYQNAMRNQFKSDNPGMTFGQLSKYTSHMYRSLTPEEKAQWEDRSVQDKARFNEEMSCYTPPPGFDSQGILIDTHANSSSFPSSQLKKTKRPRDPDAPKRARGSYVFFTNHIRPIIMKEKPDTKFVELGALMGQRWRNISQEDKVKFEELANEDRNRFNREMEDYNVKKAEAENAAAANNLVMPQVTGSDHLQMQHFQAHQHHVQMQQQHAAQNDEAAAAMLAMVPDQQQQAYQAMAHGNPSYLQMDPNQVFSNHHNLDPNNHFQFATGNQYNGHQNTRGV